MSTPWSNQAISLIILTEATTGFSGMFGYSPSPGAGNLIFSLAASAGADTYGNTYPAGLSVGGTSVPQVQLLPAAGTGAAMITLPSNAGDEAIVPAITGGTLNSGAANQQPYLAINGPANSNDTAQANYTLTLTAGSDDGTIPAGLSLTDSSGNSYLVIPANGDAPLLGIGNTFSSGIPQPATPVQLYLNGSLITYGTTSGGTVVEVFTSSSSSPWVSPITGNIKVESWGDGGGSGGGSAPSQFGNGGAGGGGGGYRVNSAVPVTANSSYVFTVGQGGAGGAAGTPNGSAAPNGSAGSGTTFTGDSSTVVTGGGGGGGTGGHNGHTGGAGGTGTHAGGTGGDGPTTGTDTGGGGGGGSAGPTGAGGHGSNASGRTPGGGGTAGGSPGGSGGGGGWGSTANNGTAGGAGAFPGGGAGAGGGGTDAHTYGGESGGKGMLRLTYTLPGSTAIEASVAGSAGTDVSGNAYAAGFTGQIVALKPSSSPSVVETWHTLGTINSWVTRGTGYCTPRYRLTPDNEVEIQFEINNSVTSSSAAVATLPSAYIPAFKQDFPVGVSMTGTPTSPPAMQVSTNGTLTVFNLAGTTTLIQACLRCPLN